MDSSIPNRRVQAIRYYMNFNKPALCNGRVTSWQYCYYDSMDQNIVQNMNFSARFFVYRRVNSDSQLYEQVPGSALTVMLEEEQVQTGGCASVDLNEAQQFPVEVNGIIGACIISNATLNPLYMIGNIRTGGLYRSDFSDSQSCTDEEGLDSIDTSTLAVHNDHTLHLSTIIGTYTHD